MHRLLSGLALLVAFSAAADPGDELLARLEHFLGGAWQATRAAAD